jgi:A/G-specific adenine glycosylase
LQDRVAGTPAPKIRAKVKEIRAVALVAGANGRYLLEQRPKKGLLGGLHGFPLEPIEPRVIDSDSGESDRNGALEKLIARFGFAATGDWFGTVSHTMTHRQLEVQVYRIGLELDSFVSAQDVALSKLDQKILTRANVQANPAQAELF